MLDIKFILNNRDAVRESIRARSVDADLDSLMETDQKRRRLLQEIDDLNHRRKMLAKRHVSENAAAAPSVAGKAIKSSIAQKETELREILDIQNRLLHSIPNVLHPNTPHGASADDNLTLRTWGEPPTFSFTPRTHVDLGLALDLFDFERAADISGAKFYYLKNEAVLLEMALIQYALNILRNKQYTLFVTPDIVRQDISADLGFAPRGNESNIYRIEDTPLCLIGTAEITLGAYYHNQRLSEEMLPIRMGGLSHCFRREAGAAGKSGKGLYRVHQFTKVEMFVLCAPQQAEALHAEIVAIEEALFQGLGIPYRVLEVCSVDLGAPAYRKFDLEAWMPGRDAEQHGDAVGGWGEVTSASNCTDYQARRLNVKVRGKEQGNYFAYMLNGTAVATSRAIIAILENFQHADGSISIPSVLQPYVGFSKIEPKP